MQYSAPNLMTALTQGNFSFAYGLSPWLFLLIAAAVPALVWLTYRQTTRPLNALGKTLFVTLRSTILILILFCLLRPIVTTTQVSPQETWLGVIFDDSQSMSIADMPGSRTRREVVNDALYAGGILDDLAESFQLRTFRFDKNAERIAGMDGLSESGTASSIHEALAHVDAQLNGLPLSGLLLITDGADNSDLDPLAKARELGARQIPVFTLGVGQETIPLDIAIVDVDVTQTLLEESQFTVSAAIGHQGYAGQEVELRVKEGDTLVETQSVTLGADGATRRFELAITPDRADAIVYELEVELQSGEIIPENNVTQFLVDNSDQDPLDILYIEGHPRNEYKFIRRAIAGEPDLRLATYLQTGPEKFYRQGIKSPTELSAGFPRDKAALFQYEALLLGDIEANFFNADQLQMIQDFVAERGGGLLMSGMIDEGFIPTPVADILPVTLVEEGFLPSHLRGGIRRGEHPTGELFVPRRTSNGEFSPLMRLAVDDGENSLRWRQLPELQGVYVTGSIKPGATTLLEHPHLHYQNQPLPIITSQRYGSGRSMLVTTASTWRYQMMMPAADQSHETLWRQLLRWLAVSAPQRITLEFDREYYNVGDEVRVTATVLDDSYEPDNNATLYMQTTDPLNETTDTPMEWDIEQDGVYRASLEVTEEGVYDLLVDVATVAGEGAADGSEKAAAFVVTPSLREFSNAGMDSGLLRRIAEASGGNFAPISAAARLANGIEYTPNAWSREVQIDLWDQPWLLALLITLLATDWIARRLRGLS